MQGDDPIVIVGGKARYVEREPKAGVLLEQPDGELEGMAVDKAGKPELLGDLDKFSG